MTFGIGSFDLLACMRASSRRFEESDEIKDAKGFIAAVNRWAEREGGGRYDKVAAARVLDVFKRGADYLDLSGLELTCLPPLPVVLMLDVSNNALTHLPRLPEGTKKLLASENRLQSLPDMPESMRYLAAGCNRLKTAPDLSWLDHIDLNDNLLANIPPLPRSPISVDLRKNPIGDFEVADLPDSGSLLLTREPLSPKATHILKTFATAQTLLAYPNLAWESRSKWQEILENNEPYCDEFFRFIGKLRHVHGMKREVFQGKIDAWLNKMADSDALREKMFSLAFEATESCEDRLLLTFEQMQTAVISDLVERGAFDGNLSKLLVLARRQFRKGRIDMIASRKISGMIAHRLRHRRMSILRYTTLMPWKAICPSRKHDEAIRKSVDQTEVRLGFSVHLNRRLELKSAVTTMFYPAWSGLTERTLDAVEERIKKEENRDFRLWLSRWPAWDAAIKRIDPEMHAAAENERYEKLEGLDQAIDTEMARLGLEAVKDDPLTRNEFGKPISDAWSDNINLARTEEFAHKYCRGLLRTYWNARTLEAKEWTESPG